VLAVDPVLRIALALALGWVLVEAGLHKLRNPRHFGALIDDYRLLPRGAGRRVVRPLGALEALVAVSLLMPFTHRTGLLGAAVLLAVYFFAMAVNLARGRREIDCGCGAPGQGQTIGAGLLGRNALLAGVALWLALTPAVSRPTVWLDWMVSLQAAAILVLLYATINRLLANRQLLGRPG
jgi:uncharacterized membrane protein YphA (DoxX/SURF4 family)